MHGTTNIKFKDCHVGNSTRTPAVYISWLML